MIIMNNESLKKIMTKKRVLSEIFPFSLLNGYIPRPTLILIPLNAIVLFLVLNMIMLIKSYQDAPRRVRTIKCEVYP